jgi:hypothetical protein
MRGFDAGQPIAGGQRHILLDPVDHQPVAVVPAAKLPSSTIALVAASRLVKREAAVPCWQRIWADYGSSGSVTRWAAVRSRFTLDGV